MNYYRREFYRNGVFQYETEGRNKTKLMANLKDYCVEVGKAYRFYLYDISYPNEPLLLLEKKYIVNSNGKTSVQTCKAR